MYMCVGRGFLLTTESLMLLKVKHNNNAGLKFLLLTSPQQTGVSDMFKKTYEVEGGLFWY